VEVWQRGKEGGAPISTGNESTGSKPNWRNDTMMKKAMKKNMRTRMPYAVDKGPSLWMGRITKVAIKTRYHLHYESAAHT
jgi:hypothetical protein